jgi:hypothetical protein
MHGCALGVPELSEFRCLCGDHGVRSNGLLGWSPEEGRQFQNQLGNLTEQLVPGKDVIRRESPVDLVRLFLGQPRLTSQILIAFGLPQILRDFSECLRLACLRFDWI